MKITHICRQCILWVCNHDRLPILKKFISRGDFKTWRDIFYEAAKGFYETVGELESVIKSDEFVARVKITLVNDFLARSGVFFNDRIREIVPQRALSVMFNDCMIWQDNHYGERS